MGKTKFYSVQKGRAPGVYSSWEACKEQVDGFSGAVFKAFKTLPEAQAFLKQDGYAGGDTLAGGDVPTA